MQSGGPVIIYRIMYDDGEEVTAPAHTLLKDCTHSLTHGTSSCASGTHRAQVLEDLRTLQSRRVCEVMPEEDVQCVQQ